MATVVQTYLSKRPMTRAMAKYLAQYIFDYACHIAVMAYLFGGGEDTLPFNSECIRRLKPLRDMAHTRRGVSVMLRVAMEYAMDPL